MSASESNLLQRAEVVHKGDLLMLATERFRQEDEAKVQARLEELVTVPGEIWMVRNVLSKEECEALINEAEKIGFSDAPLSTYGGPVMDKDVRNNTRVMIEDRSYCDRLFRRLRRFIPDRVHDSWSAVSLNERFRFYKYEPGQYFNKHYDGCFARSATERSFITCQVYLNDTFTGGATRFFDPRLPGGVYDAVPVQGSAIFFRHAGWLHSGSEVERGTKYIIRTDVMYRK